MFLRIAGGSAAFDSVRVAGCAHSVAHPGTSRRNTRTGPPNLTAGVRLVTDHFQPMSKPLATVRTSWPSVLALRLARHHLAERTTPDRLVDVVAEMVGLHAQVMS